MFKRVTGKTASATKDKVHQKERNCPYLQGTVEEAAVLSWLIAEAFAGSYGG